MRQLDHPDEERVARKTACDWRAKRVETGGQKGPLGNEENDDSTGLREDGRYAGQQSDMDWDQ